MNPFCSFFSSYSYWIHQSSLLFLPLFFFFLLFSSEVVDKFFFCVSFFFSFFLFHFFFFFFFFLLFGGTSLSVLGTSFTSLPIVKEFHPLFFCGMKYTDVLLDVFFLMCLSFFEAARLFFFKSAACLLSSDYY